MKARASASLNGLFVAGLSERCAYSSQAASNAPSSSISICFSRLTLRSFAPTRSLRYGLESKIASTSRPSLSGTLTCRSAGSFASAGLGSRARPRRPPRGCPALLGAARERLARPACAVRSPRGVRRPPPRGRPPVPAAPARTRADAVDGAKPTPQPSRSRRRRGGLGRRGERRARLASSSCTISRDLGRGQRLARPRQQLRDRLRLRAARELGREVRDRRLVGLDRVEAGHATRRAAVGAGELVARRRVAALLARAAELVVERAGGGRGARAAATSAGSAASTSRGAHHARELLRVEPASRAAAAISSGSSSRPPIIARTRSRRSSASSALGRVQPRGHDGAAGRLRRRGPRVGRGVDRHPVAALQAGRALRELLGLARLERQDDHPRRPLAAGRRSASAAAAHRLGREGERARRIGEMRERDARRPAYRRVLTPTTPTPMIDAQPRPRGSM